MKQYFITGTDTEVGKTYVTCQLLKAAQKASLGAIGYKPIAAGCEQIDGEWVNEDALNIQKACSKIRANKAIKITDNNALESANEKSDESGQTLPLHQIDESGQTLPLHQINPIALKPAIAPHIAALEEGVALTFESVAQGLDVLNTYQPDILLMEGAGGWRLPLTVGDEFTPTYYLSDVVKTLKMDVILVVGMRLGCLNHALLTAEAIRADGLTIKGWVANDITGNMTRYEENLRSLIAMLPEPLLAEIPYQLKPNEEALLAAIEQIR
ncbi:dethiobiotin synthase [Alteromonas sp. KUL106]|uniref:dethiobiotin synthase n=1 Tax=Alteromonas sp. KUL106 TaxID=2480799 RepID=UPI0012E63B88|nr:dethiobiotin synthase [Alteromonas sp. KUL106]GFD69612.1 ATP-dependent dethiobiotin synthetase BioD [Alteromonas sp. KUL106]GFD80607.1 ATP-dependent dethiobiotin synthetase BioD [Tenacibaculum sp. KUL118]